jgi:hypothetical protein
MARVIVQVNRAPVLTLWASVVAERIETAPPKKARAGETFWIELLGRPLPAIKTDGGIRAFSLYERFRPVIPEGVRGWGAKGELDLDLIFPWDGGE